MLSDDEHNGLHWKLVSLVSHAALRLAEAVTDEAFCLPEEPGTSRPDREGVVIFMTFLLEKMEAYRRALTPHCPVYNAAHLWHQKLRAHHGRYIEVTAKVEGCSA